MKWTPEVVKQKILTDQRWLERAVVAIYERQIEREQDLFITEDYNERGFNNVDCRTGAFMAQWIKKGNHLTGKWIVLAKKIMPKYVNQLTAIAQGKEKEMEVGSV